MLETPSSSPVPFPRGPGLPAPSEAPRPGISVIAPVFNEEQSLPELYTRLRDVLDGLGRPWELILVDDGSRDGTPVVLEELSQQDRRLRALRLSRNFGHHVAITAGLDFARGDLVVLMDGDLQHRPEDIPRFVQTLEEGDFDVVAGVPRKQRVSWFKRTSSSLYNRLLQGIIRDPIAIDSNIYRIMRRKVVDSFRRCRERSRYVTGLLAWVGFRRGEMAIDLDIRHAGSSKYNLPRMLRLAMHSITAFSYFPLEIATWMGFGTAMLSFAYGVYLVARKLVLNTAVEGWTSLAVAIFFVGGVQMMMLGVLGAYLGRVYTEVQQRPLYVLDLDHSRNVEELPAHE